MHTFGPTNVLSNNRKKRDGKDHRTLTLGAAYDLKRGSQLLLCCSWFKTKRRFSLTSIYLSGSLENIGLFVLFEASLRAFPFFGSSPIYLSNGGWVGGVYFRSSLEHFLFPPARMMSGAPLLVRTWNGTNTRPLLLWNELVDGCSSRRKTPPRACCSSSIMSSSSLSLSVQVRRENGVGG